MNPKLEQAELTERELLVVLSDMVATSQFNEALPVLRKEYQRLCRRGRTFDNAVALVVDFDGHVMAAAGELGRKMFASGLPPVRPGLHAGFVGTQWLADFLVAANHADTASEVREESEDEMLPCVVFSVRAVATMSVPRVTLESNAPVVCTSFRGQPMYYEPEAASHVGRTAAESIS